ncbi:hypothetical protein BB497_11405 [Halomonas sp. GFAJ-1]|nr:hypothetical protein BB497_11405 [Halomonas sp. GFAJ-1]
MTLESLGLAPSTLVFVVLGITLAAFMWGRFRYDLVALAALLGSVMLGLGFVRKVGSQATVDARHAYHRLKATCQLFIACGDPATFFKPAKAAFYHIPLPIFRFIEPSR